MGYTPFHLIKIAQRMHEYKCTNCIEMLSKYRAYCEFIIHQKSCIIKMLKGENKNHEKRSVKNVIYTLTGNLILTVMLAFAEYERGMIVERTQTGKAIARQNPNYREGRPKKYLPTPIKHALQLLESGQSYGQVEKMTGISKSTLVRAKKASKKIANS